MNYTHYFDELPKWARIVLLLFVGGIVSPVYRILRYFETKNALTLVVGIVCLVTGLGNFVLQILDIITEITKDQISILAD